jgi:hypothetical protein
VAVPDNAQEPTELPNPTNRIGVASAGYRWYLTSQVLSLFGTMMSYTALFWLALHIRHGGAPALAAIDAAQCLPMLLFSRRAGTIVTRHRAARVAMVTQGLEAAGALAIGFPLLAGWMTIWYLVPLSFVVGCVQVVDLPARQTFMLDLVGPGELRRGSSVFATITGLARIAGPGVAGIIIAVSGETAVFFLNAASLLGVIAVLAKLPGRMTPSVLLGRETTQPRRFHWLLDLPRGVQAAAAMALLVGGFGLQFAVTNPLMASQVVVGAATQLFAVSATVYVQQSTPARATRVRAQRLQHGLHRLRPGRSFHRGRDRRHRRSPLGADRPRPGHRRRGGTLLLRGNPASFGGKERNRQASGI